MRLDIVRGGMLSTVQDLGRWGRQSDGVPVAGAMDLEALRLGNVMLGNDEGAAAIEVTILGPELSVDGEGVVVFAGGELGFKVNGVHVGSWRVVAVKSGDVISFSGPKLGCRGYICVGGGIDTPLLMGSRATHTKAKMGGFKGRPLAPKDSLNCGEPVPFWRRLAGFELPPVLRPDYSPEKPLLIVCGLQEDVFTEAGKETLFSSQYSLSTESDRMGARFDGPKVEHTEQGADIVSDGIPLGAVQIPGHGTPIAMLADRQTTGGYAKIGVLTPYSIQALVQRLPGSAVRFAKASIAEATEELRMMEKRLGDVARSRASFSTAPLAGAAPVSEARSAALRVTVNDRTYDVFCEELD